MVYSSSVSAPEECELDDQKGWYAANPALGIFRSLSDVEKQAKAAMKMPAGEQELDTAEQVGRRPQGRIGVGIAGLRADVDLARCGDGNPHFLHHDAGL